MSIKCTSINNNGIQCLEDHIDSTNKICALCHIKRFNSKHYYSDKNLIKLRNNTLGEYHHEITNLNSLSKQSNQSF